MERGAWWATVHGVAELDTTEELLFLPRVLELEKAYAWQRLEKDSLKFKGKQLCGINKERVQFRWLSGKESACQCRKHKRCRFDLWVRKISWRRLCLIREKNGDLVSDSTKQYSQAFQYGTKIEFSPHLLFHCLI